jgi:phage terminase large subunit-like protein
MPRELIRAPEHTRDLSLGWLAWAWIEHFCVHGPGDVQGVSLNPEIEGSLPLDDEFGGFVVDVYAHEKSGRRLYDDAFFSRAKGRAKSELAAFISLFEAFGPCRFAGFAEGGETFQWRDFRYEYAPSEPMGRTITYPFIRCLATEESQAGNTYDNIYFNLEEGPLGEDLPGNANGLTRIFIPGGGEIRPSTAANSSKDGGKESFVVFDETHLYVLPELRRMYATVSRNKSKRKAAAPWSLQTSTMYQPGEESSAEKTHERARLIREGKVREHRLLFDHREAPADVDMTSRKAIVAALREVYGPFADAMDLDGMVDREFWNVERDPEDSRRYFFNQPTAARDAWVTHPEWEANKRDDLEPLEYDDEIVLFFDGSKSDDSTGLVGVRCSDGAPFLLGAWEKPERTDEWKVPSAAVDRRVREITQVYRVLAFYADVKEFEQYVDSWAADPEISANLLVDATVGKSRHAVAWDMRSHVKDFTEACERTLVDIQDKSLPHNGDPRLQRHVLNARRKPNRYGVSISKTGRESPHKIDFAVCLVGARKAWRDLLASPAWQKRKTKRTGKVW